MSEYPTTPSKGRPEVHPSWCEPEGRREPQTDAELVAFVYNELVPPADPDAEFEAYLASQYAREAQDWFEARFIGLDALMFDPRAIEYMPADWLAEDDDDWQEAA